MTAHLAQCASEVSLKRLLGLALVGPDYQHLGHIHDVVATVRRNPGAILRASGLVVDLGGVFFFVPSDAVRNWNDPRIQLTDRTGVRLFRMVPEEVLLRRALLGHHVRPSATSRTMRVTDLVLRREKHEWIVWSMDTRTLIHRFLGRRPRFFLWSYSQVLPTSERRHFAGIRCRV